MGYIGSAFFRSLLIQSSWNFERMQSLGFFYSIAPAIRAIHKTEGLKEAAKRHLEFFNTNPYMAPAIIGATIKLEEEGASDGEIKDLKNGLMGAYGAVGDSLFWNSLRPFAAVLGVILAVKGLIWAPLVFLSVYNLPHLFIRTYGLVTGYRRGRGVVDALRKLDIPGKVQAIKGGTIFLAGALLSVVEHGMEYGIRIWMLLILFVFVSYTGLERGIRVEILAGAAVAMSMILSLFL